MEPVYSWTSNVVDDLMMQGSLMYTSHKPRDHVYFNGDDLPGNFNLFGQDIETEAVFDEALYGVFHCTDDDIDCQTLVTAFTHAFSIEDGCLFTMQATTIAVMKMNGKFMVLDTHSRDANGIPNPNGKAGVFTYQDMCSLCRHLVRQCRLIGATNREVYFELSLFRISLRNPNSTSFIVVHQHTNVREPEITPNTAEPAIDAIDGKAPVYACNSGKQGRKNYYWENENYRERVKSTRLAAYHENNLNAKRRNLYETNKDYREAMVARSAKEYKGNETYRETKKMRSPQKYKDNERHREAVKTRSAKKYAEDEGHREAKKTLSAKKYAEDEGHREAKKTLYAKKYADDEGHREAKKTLSAKKYAVDEGHREAKKTLSAKKYADDEGHREAKKMISAKKYAEDEGHREVKKTLSVNKYAEDETHRQKVKELAVIHRQTKKDQQSDINNAIKEFHLKAKQGPIAICCVCLRLWFEDKVRVCRPNNFSGPPSNIINDCLDYFTQQFPHKASDKLFICHTCLSHVEKSKIPPQASINNMQLFEQDVLGLLNSLEQQLVALFIPFEKLVTLPRSRQKAMKGPLVCVPSNIEHTINSLPVPAGQSKIVPVYLKRRLIYEGHSGFQLVDSVKINRALQTLKTINPLYEHVEIDEDWADIVDERLLDKSDESLADPEPAMDDEASTDDSSVSSADNDRELTIGGHVMDSCLQPIDLFNEICPEALESISVAPAEGNTPVSLFREPLIEAKAFPSLFPNSRNAYDQARNTKLSRCDYYKARVYSADTRFAKNCQYIFFAQYAYEAERLLSSISINLRKGSNARNVDASMFRNKEAMQQFLKTDQGFKFFQPVRGSPEFWKRATSDLFAFIRNLGLPTWFLTLSSAELSRWTSHLDAIMKQNGVTMSDEQILNMDYKDKCEVLKSNPVTAVRMFYHRFELFMKLILLGPSQPIGKVKDYFYRIEMQQRGCPHVHMLIWVENSPKYKVNSNEEVCHFIDKYISASLPNEESDPELYDLVKSVQTHSKSHSATCRKNKRKTKCRFNFPRCVAPDTTVIEPDESSSDSDKKDSEKLLSQLVSLLESGTVLESPSDIYKSCGFNDFASVISALRSLSKKPSILLKRNIRDVWVNNYNPDLLRAWCANIDLQYVLDPYGCVVYILSYICKSESEMSQVLKTARDEMIRSGMNCNSSQGMKSLGHKYFTHREVSVQEAIIRLCGLKLKEFSRQVVFVPTDEDEVRISRPLADILNEERNNDEIWMTSLYDRYLARPVLEEFENMYLAKFAADYRVLAKAEANKCKSVFKYKLSEGLGYILKRTRSKSAVIRYCRHSPQAEPEKYALSMLKLYLPHRQKTQLCPPQYVNYQSFLETASVKLLGESNLTKVSVLVNQNERNFNVGCRELDNAMDVLNSSGNLEDAWGSLMSNAEFVRANEMAERAGQDNDDIEAGVVVPEFQEQTTNTTPSNFCQYVMSDSTLKPLLRMMNDKQRDIFHYIRDWCLRSVNSHNKVDPFHIFVTGGAGVGKSHLIRCVQGACSRLLRKADSPSDKTIALMAPTGCAAANIDGRTVHSLLKIPVQSNRNYQPLSCDSMNSLRASLENLKIIIIDEVSMIGPTLFHYIDCRLRQIMGVSQSSEEGIFGNVSILAVGDFYQLPPVGQPSLLSTSTGYQAYGIDLFKSYFQKTELTLIMRQREDAVFAEALNRLRMKSKAEPIDPDIDQLLTSRVSRDEEPADTLHVFSTNRAVRGYNEIMVHEKCENVFHIESVDYQRDKASGKLIAVSRRQKGKHTDLPDVLTVGVEARVMLMRTIDLEHSLANGIFGTVVGFAMDNTETHTIREIYIKFDIDRVGRGLVQNLPRGYPENTVAISRREEPLEANRTVVRRQFPLKLGWAATVHKTQGMSIPSLVYDMQNSFAPGQCYVALSRVTSLDGLFLRNYKPELIYRDDTIHANLNLMPTLDLTGVVWPPRRRMILHNVQGVRSKLEDINVTYSQWARVMCLTETWLNASIPDHAVEILGFQIFRTDRGNHSKRGGTAIYIAKDQQFEQIDIPPSNCNVEITMLALTVSSGRIVLGCVYRPSSTDRKRSLDYISGCIVVAENVPNTQAIIISGDFNEDLLSANGNFIYDMFIAKGFCQKVRQPTYESGSLLDAVYMKGTLRDLTVQSKPIFFSDHDPVLVNF